MAHVYNHFSSEVDITTKLSTLFESVNVKYESDVCRLVPIQDDLYCLFLSLPKSLRHVCSSMLVYRWNSETIVFENHDLDMSLFLEKKLLLRWLIPQLKIKSCEMSVYPREETIRQSKPPKQFPVVREIEFQVETISQSHLTSSVVKLLIVRKVNRDMVKYKPYVQKLLETFLAENVEFECFCVLEVLPKDDIHSLRDLVSFEDSLNQEVFVYSAFPPQHRRITCVILHMPVTTPNKGMRFRLRAV